MSAKPTTKPAAKKAAKKTAAKKKAKRSVRPGYMGSKETVPLAIAAREAYDYQLDLGNIEAGTSFNDWRRAEVRKAFGRDGLTDCLSTQFKDIMAHFQILAGKDAEAFANAMQTGQATPEEGDTHEGRRVQAHLIMEAIAKHIWLANVSAQELAQETENTAVYQDLRRRRETIRNHPKRELKEGYVVKLARDKTGRPKMNLGRDLKAGLAERCKVSQLIQIRDTLINRIAEREGVEQNEKHPRNSKQKSDQAKAERSPHELAPRIDLSDVTESFWEDE